MFRRTKVELWYWLKRRKRKRTCIVRRWRNSSVYDFSWFTPAIYGGRRRRRRCCCRCCPSSSCISIRRVDRVSAPDWHRPPVTATSCVRGAVTPRWLVVRWPADDLGHRPVIGQRRLVAGWLKTGRPAGQWSIHWAIIWLSAYIVRSSRITDYRTDSRLAINWVIKLSR